MMKHSLIISWVRPALLFTLATMVFVCRGAEMARPWTFWYWMYGAVSKPGIKADLQAMKDVGLSGCYLMPIRGVGEKPEFEGTAQQLSPKFWEMVDYAMQQADSVGLEMGIHICDGFALAGGPWITPEESMQQVVWSDTVVSSEAVGAAQMALPTGQEVARLNACPPSLLPPPPVPAGSYYEDIAVFVCPVWGESPSPSSIGGTIVRDEKGTFRAKEAGFIQYDYGQPVTVRSIEIAPSANNIQSQRLLVQASTDDSGTTFTDVRQLIPPRQGWQNTSPQMAVNKPANHYTYSLPETTARHFRFYWTPEGTEPGAEDLDAAKWSPVLKLNDIRLSAEPVIDQYESKNGSSWRIPIGSIDSKVSIGSIPPTAYRILRFGHTTTNHQNATAGGGKGLECDKFSAEAVGKQIDGWFGEFMKRPHHDVVRYMHVDSWECGSQNWSRNFAAEFQKRRGYDLLPFMPVYAGIPIDSMAEAKTLELTSDRVLHDIRQTINDLLHDVFFATVKQRAGDYGLQLSCESVAPTMVADGMEHYKYADLPMGEYWLNSPTHDKPNDMLDAISGAHVYGKRIVQAEGFTEVRGVWDEAPADLKTLVDRNLALGMNRLFFHVFTHNPWTDRRPGMTLDGIGLFFQRDQTWFPEARAFVEYIARCQQWLQRGWPVADIAVYTGDEMPRRAWRPEQLVDMLPGLIGSQRVEQEHHRMANKGVPMEESPVGVRHTVMADPQTWVNPIGGYCYDSVNPEALLALGGQTRGDTIAGLDGRYRFLVVPEGVLLSDAAQTRIEELRRAGMTIIDKPYRASQLPGVAPDVMLPPSVAFCHRRDGSQDIYFLANQTDSLLSFTATFRIHDKGVIVYDPMTDRYISPIEDIFVVDTLTAVRLTMQPRQSLFVLFGTKGITAEVTAKWIAPMKPGTRSKELRWRLGRQWQLDFAETGRRIKSDTLFSWHTHNDADVRYYSGHVKYKTTIDISKSSSPQSSIVLTLGEVHDVAHVWVNGHDAGILWTPPYEVSIGHWLRKGKNTLEIEVVNTWHNALRGLDQGTPPFPGIWTNARYRTKGDALLPAGLCGPVELLLK